MEIQRVLSSRFFASPLRFLTKVRLLFIQIARESKEILVINRLMKRRVITSKIVCNLVASLDKNIFSKFPIFSD